MKLKDFLTLWPDRTEICCLMHVSMFATRWRESPSTFPSRLATRCPSTILVLPMFQCIFRTSGLSTSNTRMDLAKALTCVGIVRRIQILRLVTLKLVPRTSSKPTITLKTVAVSSHSPNNIFFRNSISARV